MNIVFVWVWWIGVSSLAIILKNIWYDNIIWIDNCESQITNKLKNQWIKIIIWHWKYDIKFEDFVIYSDATINSPEIKKSFELSKIKWKTFHKPFSYFEFIWEISKYFTTLSIAWTHGKSTTTAMTIDVLSKIDMNFWIWITWALVPWFWNENFVLNQNKIDDIKSIFNHILTWSYKSFDHNLIKKYTFIIEADEFNRHFMLLDTDYAIILNIELDHSDVYWTFENYFETFIQFGDKTRKYVLWLDYDPTLIKLNKELPNKVKLIPIQRFNFKSIFWQHNQKNASLSYELIRCIVENTNIKGYLEQFWWLRRRMEHLYTNNDWANIYTDYWHHPSELKAVYEAFKENFPNMPISAIFQPHQARRVLEFWDEFIDVLKKFDKIIIYDIYIARENIVELKKQFKNKDFNEIEEVGQLGNLFAEKSWGTYTININEIKKIIENWESDENIIIFTAWDLDFKIRNWINE